MDSTALMKMGELEMMKRIEMARFPQELTPADKRLLAQVAITYGFDPLMGEVSIYQGRPFVSIDGRYRKAQETNELDGVETRPSTKQEREDWQIPDGDFFFRCGVYVKGARRPMVGWGRVFARETTGSPALPVVKNPQRMAEKRAEAQALRKAFHIPLPSIEDIGSPDYEVKPTVTITEDRGRPKAEVAKPVIAPQSEAIKAEIDSAFGEENFVEKPGQPMKASDAQIRAINANAKKMGYQPPELSACVKEWYGTDNLRELTILQGNEVLGKIERGEGLQK